MYSNLVILGDAMHGMQLNWTDLLSVSDADFLSLPASSADPTCCTGQTATDKSQPEPMVLDTTKATAEGQLHTVQLRPMAPIASFQHNGLVHL